MAEKQRRITLGYLAKNGTDGLTESEKAQAGKAYRPVGDTMQKFSEEFANSTRQAFRKMSVPSTLPAYDIPATIRGMLNQSTIDPSQFASDSPLERVLTNALIKANNSTQAQPTAPAKAQEIDAYAQLRKVTKEQVLEALKKNDENVSATARELGVDRKTVRKHIPAKRDKPSTVKRTANNPFGL